MLGEDKNALGKIERGETGDGVSGEIYEYYRKLKKIE
jgi:hypothetical protein